MRLAACVYIICVAADCFASTTVATLRLFVTWRFEACVNGIVAEVVRLLNEANCSAFRALSALAKDRYSKNDLFSEIMKTQRKYLQADTPGIPDSTIRDAFGLVRRTRNYGKFIKLVKNIFALKDYAAASSVSI